MSALDTIHKLMLNATPADRAELVTLRDEFERMQRHVLTLGHAVIDCHRPKPAPLYTGPAPVAPGFPVSPDEE